MSNDGTDQDYVYDTYVRYDRQPLANATGKTESITNDLSHETAGNSIGILEISTVEDQELWDYVAGDSESEKDWNSEEEDENGMAKPAT